MNNQSAQLEGFEAEKRAAMRTYTLAISAYCDECKDEPMRVWKISELWAEYLRTVEFAAVEWGLI